MTDRKKRIEAAIKAAKKRYDNVCILSGVEYPEGAHILPRKPYSLFADKRWNIIPLQENLHKEMDKMKNNDIMSRLKFLYNNCLPEYRGKLIEQIHEFVIELFTISPQMFVVYTINMIIE